jgi:Tfp pilus assembly protein PilF
MSLQDMGDVSAAEAEYRAALKIRPAYAWTHNNLGTLLAGIPGRLPDAILEYKAALAIDPDMFTARCNLANSLSAQGRYSAARELYDEALHAHPDYADGHVGLGVMLVKMGRLDDATAQFETALQIEPGNTSAQSDLAMVRKMRQTSRGTDPAGGPAR